MKRRFALAVAITACQTRAGAPLVTAHTWSAPSRPPVVAELGARAGSTIAVVHVGRETVAYVADEDDQSLRAFDVDDERELSSLTLDGRPAQLVTLPKGRIAIALRDAAKVEIVEGAGTSGSPFRKIASVDTPVDPIGLARTPDNDALLVTSGWGHALTLVDASTFARRASVDLAREPRAVGVSDDGARAFVTHAAGDALSVIDLAKPSAKPKIWRLESESFVGPTGPFARKSNNANAIAIGEDPKGRVFVAHALSHTTAGDADNPSKETPEFAGYGGGELESNDVFDVAVVDERNGTPMDFESGNGALVRVARDDTSCLVPSAAIVHGPRLFVACLDTSHVVELDAAWFHPDQETTRTWDVPSGPTGFALDAAGERLLVWSQFARKITLLPAASDATFTIASIAVPANRPRDATLARGSELFYHRDERVSSDGRVCASCHPDGRDDGLVWTTSEGPRQTPMLAGRLAGSAPYGWRGAAVDVPTHLKTTFSRLGGKGVTGSDLDALVAWLGAMPAPNAPKVDEAIAHRGKAIFESEAAGCASCHGDSGDLPDGLLHNVRSWARGDRIGIFDTPSLRFVGGTAPYFHDGRYKDLHTLLVSVDGTMGHTKQLSPSDLDALETYVGSL